MLATRIRVSVLLLAALLGMGACGQGDPPPPPPAPEGAVEGVVEGPVLTSAQHALADLDRRLKEHFDGPWDVRYFRLPAGTTWDVVTTHYDGELGGDWFRDSRYSPDPNRGYLSMVWRDGDFSVGVALVDGASQADGPVLVVMASEKD